MAFLERTMPLGARFPVGQVFREDRFPVPLDALREILLNAVMHRDYTDYSGYVAIVVFDDRIEIRSYGRLPTGITVDQLSGRHDSKPTNPLIAGAFHRTGAVEVWGRGTNRVIAACKKHGAAPPVFEERQGFLIVTFRASLVAGGAARTSNGRTALRSEQPESQPESRPESQPESQPESLDQRVLALLEPQALGKAEISAHLGQKKVSGQLNKVIRTLMGQGLIEYTLPETPNSRLQKYWLTPEGDKALKGRGGEDTK
jgi:ATP-dependent DNA helicase RecG